VLTLALLALAAGVAGGVNAVAGGGTLITFPALVAAGYAPKIANVTNTVAIWPGTIGGSLAYRGEIAERRHRALALLPASILGAAAGAALLLLTPATQFARVVPWLIYFACVLLAFQGRLARLAVARGLHTADAGQAVPPVLHVAVFFVAVYGGYFGAGIGILMLAFLGIVAPDTLHHSNALKGLLALVINFVALVAFALFSQVAWGPAAVMAVASTAGGYLGVRIARRVNPVLLRTLIVAYGAVVATVLLLRS
jgi:uncharacterized membrane protein YfcA